MNSVWGSGTKTGRWGNKTVGRDTKNGGRKDPWNGKKLRECHRKGYPPVLLLSPFISFYFGLGLESVELSQSRNFDEIF